MSNRSNIEQWLVAWFEKNSNVPKEAILNKIDANYFEEAWIDSFKFVSFIMEMEDSFNIKFSNDEFQDRGFSTITGLTKIIRKRLDDRDNKI